MNIDLQRLTGGHATFTRPRFPGVTNLSSSIRNIGREASMKYTYVFKKQNKKCMQYLMVVMRLLLLKGAVNPIFDIESLSRKGSNILQEQLSGVLLHPLLKQLYYIVVP